MRDISDAKAAGCQTQEARTCCPRSRLGKAGSWGFSLGGLHGKQQPRALRDALCRASLPPHTRESTWEGRSSGHSVIQRLQEFRTHVEDPKSWIWLGKSCTKWSHGGMMDAKATLALLELLGGLFTLESQPGGGLILSGKVNASPCSLQNQLAGFI